MVEPLGFPRLHIFQENKNVRSSARVGLFLFANHNDDPLWKSILTASRFSVFPF